LGRKVHAYVHILVLEAFVGPCPAGMECRHLNGKGDDNQLSNLKWDTHSVNMLDKKPHGMVNANHKISFEAAREIHELIAQDWTNAALAKKFGCSWQNISRIRKGEIHTQHIAGSTLRARLIREVEARA
jgi:hypothetical protein